jgi:hypothetical protein
LDRRLVDHRAGLDAETRRKILCPVGNRNPVVYFLSVIGEKNTSKKRDALDSERAQKKREVVFNVFFGTLRSAYLYLPIQ